MITVTYADGVRWWAGCGWGQAWRRFCPGAVVVMVAVGVAALGGCTSAAPGRTAAGTRATAGRWVWRELSPAVSPPGRDGAALAYDPATSSMLLFSGFGDGYLDDTWSWNGTTWTQLSPAVSPPAREGGLMTYDAATRTMLLFGGFGLVSSGPGSQGDGGLGDTWSWNGTTWTSLSPASSPGADIENANSMTYDPVTRTVLLFGARSCGCGRGQTWSWNGTTWTMLSPPASPPGTGDSSSMAYDPVTRTVLLYDEQCTGCAPSQLWSWNGTTWTRLSPAGSRPANDGWAIAYDPASRTVIAFGGIANEMGGLVSLDETWSWNGTAWTWLSSAGRPFEGDCMAYDAGTKALFLATSAEGNQDEQLNGTWILTARSRPSRH